MRDYEAVYIFDSSLEEAQVNEKLERYHGLLTGDESGTVTEVDHWGKRQLAYPIADSENGYYVVAHFNTGSNRLPEYERILQLDEQLLRYLIVVNEGDLQTSPAPLVEESRDDDDGDEED